MDRDVALGIGVAQAGKLAYLRGAINGAKDFCRWAEHQGYETTLLTDEDAPGTVTLMRLRQVLDQILAKGPIHRLVFYFAGHGLICEADQGLWLLADWDTHAVAMDKLRRKLYRYPVRQITFFSDACRSLPRTIDTLDITQHGVLADGREERKEHPVDRFVAAQDGKEAFMLPGEAPEEDRCLFSGVVLEALWGMHADAFSKVQPGKITSGSLGQFLREAVPAKAKEYGRKLDPSLSTSFPEGDNVYLDNAKPIPASGLPPWPVPNSGEPIRGGGGILGMGERALDKLSGLFGIDTTDTVTSGDGEIEIPTPSPEPVLPPLAVRLRRTPQPNGFETGSGFSAAGGNVAAVWLPEGLFAEQHGDRNWWRIGEDVGFQLQRSAPAMIEFDDGVFAAGAALPQFIGAILREGRRIDALVYRRAHSPRETTATAEEALTQMEQGTMRADSASDLAVRMRIDKHADPVMGVISAYLYESIGDFDSIRRMAYFYCTYGQPIPYDIALLARLNVENRNARVFAKVPAVEQRQPRTEDEARHDWTYRATWETEGEVGGAWPWLRQGWLDLEDTMDKTAGMFDSRLLELTPQLRPGRFATFEKEGAELLARLFQLKRRKER